MASITEWHEKKPQTLPVVAVVVAVAVEVRDKALRQCHPDNFIKFPRNLSAWKEILLQIPQKRELEMMALWGMINRTMFFLPWG